MNNVFTVSSFTPQGANIRFAGASTSIITSGGPGASGDYISRSETGQFITTGQTGQFITSGALSSQYVTTSQTGQFASSASTGALLPYVGARQTVNLNNQILTNVKSLDTPALIKMSGAQPLSIQGEYILDADPSVVINTFTRSLVHYGSGTLNWASRYLSGNWSGDSLSINGSSVVTQNQTGNLGTNLGVISGIAKNMAIVYAIALG